MTGLRRTRLFFAPGARSTWRAGGIALSVAEGNPGQKETAGIAGRQADSEDADSGVGAVAAAAIPRSVEAKAVAIPHHVFGRIAEFSVNAAALAAAAADG